MRARLGIDIGGTKINMGILDENNHVIAKEKMPVPKELSCKEIMAFVAEKVTALLTANGLSKEDVISVGIGVPGTVMNGVVINAPNLFWENEPCADYFNQYFGMVPRVTQDTRAAAWGEYQLGGGKGSKGLVCITIGTGVGCGIVIDGKIFNGALGTAGETGHIPVMQTGRKCNCGGTACMEAYASGVGMATTASQSPYFEGREISTKELFELAENGDAHAKEIISEACNYLGQALCAVINVLSPDTMIFSGGICTQEELYIKPLIRFIRERAYPLAVGDSFKISISSLGEDAPMLGAALLDKAM